MKNLKGGITMARKKKTDSETYTKSELEKLIYVYEEISDKIKEAAKRSTLIINPIKKVITEFADKNSNILQSNIIGKQLLLNEKVQNEILDYLGFTPQYLKETIKESPYFKSFGGLQLTDQLVFAIPLLLLSGEFARLGKKVESHFFYNIAFYKPYAARVSQYFPLGVNEDQMMYTIENLSERFDIKKYGTLLEVLEKMANSSYENYIDDLQENVTDKDLHVIFTAGIYSRVNSFVQSITREYHKNKGKYLPFEQGTFEGTDDSEGETFERDIQSDAAVKYSMVRKVISDISKNPVDEKIADISARYGFIGLTQKMGDYKYSGMYTDIIKNTISNIIEKDFKNIPVFIESIIGSFLFNINPNTGKKYGVEELKSPVFLTGALKVFKSPNSKDQNILKARNMLNDMLKNNSVDYINFGVTQKRNLKNAVYFYFILLIQKS